MSKRSDMERLFRKTIEDRDTQCWVYTGKVKKYGTFYKEGRSTSIHKASYELFIGNVPNGLEIDHLCRNKKCANPWHLEAVTHQENINRVPKHLWGKKPSTFTHRNTKKTHCKRNHELSGHNLIVTKQGRQCRQCKKDREFRYRSAA